MKIYFDQFPAFSVMRSDCDCGDCGDCPKVISSGREQKFADGPSFQARPLQLVTPLYRQLCAEEHWLVCHPNGLGRIAVLDREALALLDLFQEPVTPGAIVRAQPAWSPGALTKMVQFFYRLGFLQEPDAGPVQVIEDNSHMLTAWLHVTNACNLRCTYCYIQKTQERMQMETGFQAIDAIFRSALKHHLHAIHLKYAGGEASLHMAGVTALHDYAQEKARQHGITLTAQLLSNGMVLSTHAIEDLQARGIGVSISLDGVGETHDRQRVLSNGQGSFQYVQRTITRLLEHGLVPQISVTVSQRNLEGLPALIHYLLERELPFSLNYYRDHSSVLLKEGLRSGEQELIAGMRAAFRAIEERLPGYSLLGALLDKGTAIAPHRYTCSMGRNYLVIDQRGGVAKCQAEIRRSVTTIEDADPLQTIREDTSGVRNLAVEEKEGCRTCDWRYWCTGGCPLLTYQVTGRNDIKSPNCGVYQALFPDVLRLEALRLLRHLKPASFEKMLLSVG